MTRIRTRQMSSQAIVDLPGLRRQFPLLAPPHIGGTGDGGSSGIGGGCGCPNAASAADMAP
jgi:hypothetical protein